VAAAARAPPLRPRAHVPYHNRACAGIIITRLLSVGVGSFQDQLRVSAWLALLEIATRVLAKWKDMAVHAVVVRAGRLRRALECSLAILPPPPPFRPRACATQRCQRPPWPYYYNPRQLRLAADVQVLCQLMEQVGPQLAFVCAHACADRV